MQNLLNLMTPYEKQRALASQGFTTGTTNQMNQALFNQVDKPLLQAVFEQNNKNRMMNAFNRPTGSLSALTSGSTRSAINRPNTFVDPNMRVASPLMSGSNRPNTFVDPSMRVPTPMPQQRSSLSNKASTIGKGLLNFAQSPYGEGFATGLLKAGGFSPRPISFAEALGTAMEQGQKSRESARTLEFEREKFNEQIAQNTVANFLASKKLDIDQQKLLQPQLSNFTKSLIAAGIEPSSEQGISLLEKELAKASTTINLDKTDQQIKLETFKMDRDFLKEEKKTIRGQKEINQKLTLMKNLLESGEIETNKFAGFRREILGIAQAFDLLNDSELAELEGLQTFESLASYIIPRMRAVGSGATSDFEVSMYTRAAPNITNTTNGNLKIIAGFQQVNEFNIRKSNEMEKWLRKNKSLDGFETFWDEETGDQVFPQYSNQENFDELVKSGKLKKNQYVIYNPSGDKFAGELIFYTGEEQ